MQIITDSAALLSRQEGITMGVDVIPLSVIVNGRSYLDLEELDGSSLIEIINQGHFPTTSQPSVGETLEVFQNMLMRRSFISPWRMASPVPIRTLALPER